MPALSMAISDWPRRRSGFCFSALVPGTRAFAARCVAMAFPLDPRKTAPMEARIAEELPPGSDWQFEPKWDGFRCLAFGDGRKVALQAKSGKPLTVYFPEIATALAGLKIGGFVLDGEMVIPVGNILSFDALQARLHPAESRRRRLAAETPARLVLFDILA